jgi:ornithine carbamoyltransferase
MKRDLVSFSLWSSEQLSRLLELSDRFARGEPDHLLRGRTVALVFERESLRTRVAFEVGIVELGGHPIFLHQQDIGMAARESVHDIAQVLSGYVSLIVARTIRHQTCLQLAEGASVPVVNALTDLVHPCQVLADALTLQQAGRFAPSTRIVYVGAGNSIANSWVELAVKLPLSLTLSCPAGYEPHAHLLQDARSAGLSTIELLEDPAEAVRDAEVIYTDVWPSDRTDGGERPPSIFGPYQVNRKLLSLAQKDCLVMHRLPANRGEEITGEVLDSRQSLVLRQAANRVPVHKAVMRMLLEP